MAALEKLDNDTIYFYTKFVLFELFQIVLRVLQKIVLSAHLDKQGRI